MSEWTLIYYPPASAPAVTKRFDEWGLSNLTRSLKSFATDEVSFVAGSLDIDDDELFEDECRIVIKKDGVPWFDGFVTETPATASSSREQHEYTVSGPWWLLEQRTMQQEWNYRASEDNPTLVPTLKTTIIMGQDTDGAKLSLGYSIEKVVDYCLACEAPGVPFVVGEITPSMTIPYAAINDRTCAQVIQAYIQWVPDAVQWFDYTTTPPTLHIKRRSELAPVALAAFNDRIANEGINIRPRYDLLVPVVVLKYDSVNTYDGFSYSSRIVKQYPPDVSETARRALVTHIDLAGSDATFQRQIVGVSARPRDPGDSGALSFILNRDPSLKQAKSGGLFDTENIQVETLVSVIDENDPLLVEFPGFDPGGLGGVLDSGAITPWMKDQGIKAAKVRMTFKLIYIGLDELTDAFINGDDDGRITTVEVIGTNANSQEYQQLTNASSGELPPEGLERTLYEGMSVLHYQGTITMSEEECSSVVGIGNVLNLTGTRRAEWETMNAVVISIDESVDQGRTRIRIGPPSQLSAQQWVEAYRCTRNRVSTFQLQQRVDGKATGATNVQGHSITPVSNTIPSPSDSFIDDKPFTVRWRLNPSDPSLFQAKVELKSNLQNSTSPSDNVPITGLDTWFPLNANDTIWLVASVAGLTVTAGTPTIHSYGQGHDDFNDSAEAWTPGGIVEDDDDEEEPEQIVFRRPIAISTADDDGKPNIKQMTNTQLVVKNVSIEGRAAIYPF